MMGVIPLVFFVALVGSIYWGVANRRLPHVAVGWAWVASLVVCVIGLVFTTGGRPSDLPTWSGVVLISVGVMSIVGNAFVTVLLVLQTRSGTGDDLKHQ